MAELRGTTVQGSNSITFSGTAGKVTRVVQVGAHFASATLTTGTLELQEDGTTVWRATVAGGLHVMFPGDGWEMSVGADATLVLSGAHLFLVAAAEY